MPREAIMENKAKPNMQKLGTRIDVPTWKCTACKNVLATTNEKKTEVRIKYKDFYCHVQRGGTITVICRKCGEFNTVETVGSAAVD